MRKKKKGRWGRFSKFDIQLCNGSASTQKAARHRAVGKCLFQGHTCMKYWSLANVETADVAVNGIRFFIEKSIGFFEIKILYFKKSKCVVPISNCTSANHGTNALR